MPSVVGLCGEVVVSSNDELTVVCQWMSHDSVRETRNDVAMDG
jgi:hypothetical protein